MYVKRDHYRKLYTLHDHQMEEKAKAQDEEIAKHNARLRGSQRPVPFPNPNGGAGDEEANEESRQKEAYRASAFRGRMKDFKEPVVLVNVRPKPSDKTKRSWRARFRSLAALYPIETQSGVVGPDKSPYRTAATPKLETKPKTCGPKEVDWVIITVRFLSVLAVIEIALLTWLSSWVNISPK